MTAVVLAVPAPYVPPPPPVVPFRKALLTWTGVDGSVWDLTDSRQGVFLTQGGIEGLHLPEWTDYTDSAAGIDGQTYLGSSSGKRQVEWPVYLWADDSSGWYDIDRAWWRSFFPRGGYGTWTVQTPTGQARTLTCRLTSDGGFAFDRDAGKFGWVDYPVSLVADDPFWYGDPIRTGWLAPERIPFFGGTPGDGLLHISTADTASSATLTNPGDVETWLRWTVRGPVTSGTLTVDGGDLSIPELAEGDVLVIDSDPKIGTEVLNGTDTPGLVETWDPRPLPPGVNVPVGIHVNSPGGWQVDVEAPAKYWRAW